ncbi:GIY-YIG nuclease family protein [Pontiellaceae bacterium B1224]|nr:GIY-YIG nuclease family protein [Pontiellaceae bacterium B1224]
MASHLEDSMHYVYLIRSEVDCSKTYIGLTSDLKKRLVSHNEGANRHTAKFRPWKVECYIAFETREKAAEFEQYLKHGSGQAFAKKHFWMQ